MDQHAWRHYSDMRPDELAEMMKISPTVYWPLGLLEHHGWHLPVGFDGIKADRLCERLALRTGGVILPVMWWGGVGGHGDFIWTLYQSESAARDIVVNTTERLIAFGFRNLIFMMGHYPWESIVGVQLDNIQSRFPQTLVLWGTEATIGRPDLILPGDHAAREETSYGLSLLPELVDMSALANAHSNSAWPDSQPVTSEKRYPGVRYDTADPRFAQMGEDARTATAERGEAAIKRLVDLLAQRILAH